jgi:hypothetical protein
MGCCGSREQRQHATNHRRPRVEIAQSAHAGAVVYPTTPLPAVPTHRTPQAGRRSSQTANRSPIISNWWLHPPVRPSWSSSLSAASSASSSWSTVRPAYRASPSSSLQARPVLPSISSSPMIVPVVAEGCSSSGHMLPADQRCRQRYCVCRLGCHYLHCAICEAVEEGRP